MVLVGHARGHATLRASGECSEVAAPLLTYTKRDVVGAANRLGLDLALTWSCYAGGETPCGACLACIERKAAGA